MRRAWMGVLALFSVALVATTVWGREPLRQQARFERPTPEEIESLLEPGMQGLYQEAAVDTYCLVWYTFESMNWQGWTRADNTAQHDEFFHVDDFAGLGGGIHGGLVPLQGTKSMWCGVRPNAADPYLCSWQTAPGYGNDWHQMLCMGGCMCGGGVYTHGLVTFSYKISYDTEPGNDYVAVEYTTSSCSYGEWPELATYSGRGDTAATHTLVINAVSTKFRFRFCSDGGWSDQDGYFDGDGACVVDSIVITDATGVLDYQDFEGAAVGAKSAGRWNGIRVPAYGMYSGLRSNLADKDPCGDNLATQIVFFVGSTEVNPAYPWPSFNTPGCQAIAGTTVCQDEYVVSPVIDMTKYSTACNNVQNGTIPGGDLADLGGALLRFTVYAEPPVPNLVFYRWAVRDVVAGCPGPWRDNDFLYWYFSTGYLFQAEDVSRLLSSDQVQIAVGIVDLCDEYYLAYGDCSGHTPAPWFDNVRLYRYRNAGPQWSFRAIDLFQDNFPENEWIIESYVRADAANDINPNGDPGIRPGDSVVVSCAAPRSGGLAADPAGGPAVYMHVKCSYIGPTPTKPALAGPSLQGTYGAYKSDDGAWTIIQGDTASAGGEVAAGRYMFDLNDALFTRGYRIEYYFTARSADELESALPRWARSGEPYFEWTCLPTLTHDVLIVDDSYSWTPRSLMSPAEVYWNYALALLGAGWDADRYHVNGASSAVSNGPGSRAKNYQLVNAYNVIVWESGDLASCTISDGTVNSDKSDDCQMLLDWMNLSEHYCGLWVCGDGVASDLDQLVSAPALDLLSTWCGVDFMNDSYFDLTGGFTTGGVVNPLVTASSDLGIYIHWGYPDKFYLSGGCPSINRFDVLEKTAYGKYALSYPDFGGNHYYAAIGATNINAAGYAVRTMWFGFSYQCIRDDVYAGGLIDRVEIAGNTFQWMQTGWWHGDAETIPTAYRLAQNFPNPFNPATTIRYDMKAKGLVTIRIFDVSGRLVRTMVDGVKDAGSYSAVWDGANNLGAAAASGIYFCRMETKDFSAVKKLVLLR